MRQNQMYWKRMRGGEGREGEREKIEGTLNKDKEKEKDQE